MTASVIGEQRRNVLVTGGTSGLGRAIATGLAQAGYAVMICSRSQVDCQNVAEEITSSTPGECLGVACDITDIAALANLAEEVERHFGSLHVLVNNAGAVSPGPLEAIDETSWDRVLDVNLKGAFFLSQKVVPYLRRAARAEWPATIINIGSYAGFRTAPQPHYPYSAAKAALGMLTQNLARGLAADHVTANTIALGVFPDDSTILQSQPAEVLNAVRENIPARRFGSASDIVGLVSFLASPASAYITGATIPLDGGMHL